MIPTELVDRFRVLSLERIGKVETAWNRLVYDNEDDGAIRQMLREVHTMKGDAAVVGAREVLKLCKKLEDLLEVADELHVDISEDFEVVVTMAIQFLGMLLRVRPGAMTGIDLEGFVRQVDDVLRETRAVPTTPRARRTSERSGAELPVDRIAEPTRQRLAAAATEVFLEYLGARGPDSRSRLRGAWTTLRDELARMQVTELGPPLQRHVASTRELAEQLGKRVAIELAIGDIRVEPRVVEAVDIAVLHLMRNAIDHGIEEPIQRRRAGKPEQGLVRVRAHAVDTTVEITVVDDGCGIDLDAVRGVAIARGLLAPDAAPSEAALLDLVFQPGFSTRSTVTDLSGRGVGLDAVKAALVKVGGRVELATKPSGAVFTIVVPAPVRNVHAYHFLAPGGHVSVAVSARWSPSIESAKHPATLDPCTAFQIGAGSRQTSVEPPEPPRDLSIRLRWGFLELSLGAATEPRLVIAERICPTPDDHPVEVVVVDGHETLLLRPELVAELAAVRRQRSSTSHG